MTGCSNLFIDISMIDMATRLKLSRTKGAGRPIPVEALDKFVLLRRALNLVATKLLQPKGIGVSQAAIVRHLADEGACSQADLARATAVDPAAIGRAVDSLVRRGWAEQRENPTDRRRWDVTLTAKGKEFAGELDKVYARTAALLVSPLGAIDRKRFIGIIDKLTKGLGSVLEGQGEGRRLSRGAMRRKPLEGRPAVARD